MNDKTRSSLWSAAGVAFLAVGVSQPAFIGVGAAFIALGLASTRRMRK